MRRTLLLLAAVLPVWAQSAAVRLPPFEREEWPNGIVLYLCRKADAPLQTVRLTVRGGAESNPPGQAGLAFTVAAMLRRGTEDLPAARFQDELDSLGATFEASVGRQSTAVVVEALPDEAPEAIGLFADAILRPAFQADELRKLLRRNIDSARAVKDSQADALQLYFQSFFFGRGSPYARPAGGDETTLPSIDRAAVRSYYGKMYAGANMTLVSVGPLETGAVRAALRNRFQGLRRGRRYQWVRPARRTVRGVRALVVDKPGASQTHFAIGHPGIDRTHPDRIALWLANNIVGGRFTSLLNEALRVKAGLTYGIESYFDEDRLPGAVVIDSHAKNSDLGRAVATVMQVLRDARERGFTAEQLSAAKAYVEGQYPADSLQTSRQLAAALSGLELYGLDRNEIDDLFARIDAVTLDQVNAALREYFSPESMRIVFLGPAADALPVARELTKSVSRVSISAAGFSPNSGAAPKAREASGSAH